MKVLFKEIRAGDVDAVAIRLDAHPELVHAVATPPPKKDDGQSTLEVAIKSANNAVAELLFDRGADVNFHGTSTVHRWWTIPVLHMAVRASVFSSRWTTNWARRGEPPRLEQRHDLAWFEGTFHVLQRMLEAGADANALDSAGNPPLMRFALDAAQILEEPVQEDVLTDMRRILAALVAHGADPGWVDRRYGGEAIAAFYERNDRPRIVALFRELDGTRS